MCATTSVKDRWISEAFVSLVCAASSDNGPLHLPNVPSRQDRQLKRGLGAGHFCADGTHWACRGRRRTRFGYVDCLCRCHKFERDFRAAASSEAPRLYLRGEA